MEKELITAEPNAGPHGEAVSATQSVCSESGLLELAAQHFPPLRVVGVRDVDEAFARHANYSVLMVPQELRQNSTMRPRREYNYVVSRMASCFASRDSTNVVGLHVFGY